MDHLTSPEPQINEEKTRELQSDPKWIAYKAWLIENNCKFPSLDFPVAFGKTGYVGAMAKSNIPIKKAFIFVPYSIIITPQLSRDSELKPIFKLFPKIFDSSSLSHDYSLWLFLMNEKRKGQSSFYYPYLSIIHSPEILFDWTEEEKSELQDPFLFIKCEKNYKFVLNHFETLKKVFNAFPEFFPDDEELFSNFYWAYKIVTTRAFCQNEGMLIPLADCLNHEDVCVDYITLTEEFLLTRCAGKTLLNDYHDFGGIGRPPVNLMKTRTHKNRLEKYLSWFDNEKIKDMNAIWEIDQILYDLESSTDEEDPIHVWTSDESSEEGEEFDLHFDPSNKYFVMRTKDNGSFKAGQEVFNCYGRLHNFDMLLDYGFTLYPNRYDSALMRLFKGKLVQASFKKKKKGTKTFNLKFNQLNTELLLYLRKRFAYKSHYFNLSNTLIQEKKVLVKFQSLIEEQISLFPTLLDYDIELLSQPLSHRYFFAVRYRVSIKQILKSQLLIIQNLNEIFEKVNGGLSVKEAHWTDRSIEASRKMYPLRNYLNSLDRGDLW